MRPSGLLAVRSAGPRERLGFCFFLSESSFLFPFPAFLRWPSMDRTRGRGDARGGLDLKGAVWVSRSHVWPALSHGRFKSFWSVSPAFRETSASFTVTSRAPAVAHRYRARSWWSFRFSDPRVFGEPQRSLAASSNICVSPAVPEAGGRAPSAHGLRLLLRGCSPVRFCGFGVFPSNGHVSVPVATLWPLRGACFSAFSLCP